MKKRLLTLLVIMALLLSSSISATAFSYTGIGTNITVYDGMKGGSDTWHNTENEDQEVEYAASTGQKWDLEAFYWDATNNKLTLIAGFNLIGGEAYSGYTSDQSDYVDPGHVFIDKGNDGDWDYALTWTHDQSGTLNDAKWYAIDNDTATITTTYVTGASPWQIDFTDTANNNLTGHNLSADYTTFSDNLTGVATGDDHNAITFELSALDLGNKFSVHFTMECGNDDLEGKVVPVPGAAWLLGSGLLGLIEFRRREKG